MIRPPPCPRNRNRFTCVLTRATAREPAAEPRARRIRVVLRGSARPPQRLRLPSLPFRAVYRMRASGALCVCGGDTAAEIGLTEEHVRTVAEDLSGSISCTAARQSPPYTRGGRGPISRSPRSGGGDLRGYVRPAVRLEEQISTDVIHGRVSPKSKWDCTICRPCPFATPDSIVPRIAGKQPNLAGPCRRRVATLGRQLRATRPEPPGADRLGLGRWFNRTGEPLRLRSSREHQTPIVVAAHRGSVEPCRPNRWTSSTHRA